MGFSKVTSYFNIERKDYIYLVALLIFSFSLFTIKVLGYKEIGISDSDVIIYLCNSLYYAGLNPNDIGGVSYLYSSPVICFLTGIIFRLWHVSPTPILLVTGGFEILGNIGLYILLRNRFNQLLSFFGTILYTTSGLFLFHSTSGMLDIPAVAISIWILIFTILAVDKNYRYYLIALPLLVFGVFTRPTVGFVLPLMVLYFLDRHDCTRLLDNIIHDRKALKDELMAFFGSKEFKYISISLLISILITAIIILYHNLVFGLPVPFLGEFGKSMNGFESHKIWDYYYNTDKLFYIKQIPEFFAFKSVDVGRIYMFYIMAFVTVIGLVLKAVDLYRDRKSLKENDNGGCLKTRNLEFVFLIIFAVLGFVSFKMNYIASEISFFLFFVVLSSLLKRYSFKHDHALSLTMLAWFTFYLVFISYINMKMERYFMPLFIPVCYLVVFSMDGLFEFFNIDLSRRKEFKLNRENVAVIVSLLFIVLLLFSAFATVNHNFDGVYIKRYNNYQNVTDYLMEYDPDYMDKNITTDRFHRFYSWFLNKPTDHIDTKIYPLSSFDSCNSDYVIIGQKYKFENYTQLHHRGECYLYERNIRV